VKCLESQRHKSHDVKTLRKSLNFLKNGVEEQKLYISTIIHFHRLNEQKCAAQKEEICESSGVVKQEISRRISALKELLSRKEEQLLSFVDQQQTGKVLVLDEQMQRA